MSAPLQAAVSDSLTDVAEYIKASTATGGLIPSRPFAMTGSSPRGLLLGLSLGALVACASAVTCQSIRTHYLCHPTNPSKFYKCINSFAYSFQCPGKLHFNTKINACDWPENADCGKMQTSLPTVEEENSTTTRSPEPATAWPEATRKPVSGPCDATNCQLPECRCVGIDVPGSIPIKQVPMIITLTFDDGVNEHNFHYYKQLFNGKRVNPNGCPIRATFYVSGDYTKYDMVQQLYKSGHEIGSHTKTHRFPTNWWATASYADLKDEIVGMRNLLSTRAMIPRQDIKGMRSPFLQLSGDPQFEVLQDYHFTYDTSFVTGALTLSSARVPIWPFTLDYPTPGKYCDLKPCPENSYPGLWEYPLQRWFGNDEKACSMPDSCTQSVSQSGYLKFLKSNFNRHYTKNRAPLGISIHASWFQKGPSLPALENFINLMSEKKDVWFLTTSQMLDWVQHPTALSNISSLTSWSC